jgi:hypothetical protein
VLPIACYLNINEPFLLFSVLSSSQTGFYLFGKKSKQKFSPKLTCERFSMKPYRFVHEFWWGSNESICPDWFDSRSFFIQSAYIQIALYL